MNLWLRQVAVVARYETPRNLLRGRAMPLYLLAGLPVLVVALMVLVSNLVEESTELQTLTGGVLLHQVESVVAIRKVPIYSSIEN